MLTELQKRRFDRLFDLLDADRNGVIDLADYHRLADVSGGDLTHRPGSPDGEPLRVSFTRFWEQAINPLDSGGQGTITREQFTAALGQMVARPEGFDTALGPAVDAVFDLIDLDGDGQVVRDEYVRALTLFGLTPAAAEQTFARLDDGDGLLGRAEFWALARDFYLSDDPDSVGNLLFGPL
ncbi:EF-hand domain-containing protein [Streptosporangium carneum]|uniref:Calcium sensor EFh n=1 Tax=Streptosporangium carneum TaxID=47481 RepID=A0A9W6MG10_9ACTN|nr:EF-hand domain-containing protein [Streptosporangium carneum]GLK12642.1 calcium sensor EFh [Streptosporangium carneum]